MVNVQKYKLFIKVSRKFAIASLLACKSNAAAMNLRKDQVLHWHPNNFSVWFC